jgi:hypothetical protein
MLAAVQGSAPVLVSSTRMTFRSQIFNVRVGALFQVRGLFPSRRVMAAIGLDRVGPLLICIS